MKVLILGATGMLGHKLTQVLSLEHKVAGTVRRNTSILTDHQFFSKMNILQNVSADNLETIRTAIDKVNPYVIINCIEIVRQLPAAQDPLQSIVINSLCPHQLASISRKNNIRMSTACLFYGNNYRKEDAKDPNGKTKYLDEMYYPGSLPLRTSIIVRESAPSRRLIESFTRQNGKTVSGYIKKVFSGLTRVQSENTIISGNRDRYRVRPIVKNTAIP